MVSSKREEENNACDTRPLALPVNQNKYPMNRIITDFKLDGQGDWTAILSCGHPQHTRHRPPFENRSWVLSQDGRNSKIGEILNCVRCDDFEIPSDFVRFKVTPEFSEDTMPEGLKNNHQTGSGIWGKIVVLEGALIYQIKSKNINDELSPDRPGIIVPELSHSIEPRGPLRFFIEFYKRVADRE